MIHANSVGALVLTYPMQGRFSAASLVVSDNLVRLQGPLVDGGMEW